MQKKRAFRLKCSLFDSTKQINKQKSGLFPEKRLLTWGKPCDIIKMDKSIKPPIAGESWLFLWRKT